MEKVEKVNVIYKEKSISAKRLTISSQIQLPIEKAWSYVQTPRLLLFVAKGMIRFESIQKRFPQVWQQGNTYAVYMYLFGFIPLGKHYLYIEKIDSEKLEIATKEWDAIARIWNHKVQLKKISKDQIEYTDSITIYGGVLTRPLVLFAKFFYRHRQKRWQVIAEENKNF